MNGLELKVDSVKTEEKLESLVNSEEKVTEKKIVELFESGKITKEEKEYILNAL